MTGAPALVATLAPELLQGLIERAARPDFDAFEAQLRSSGYCARPVRLRGKIETCDAHGIKRVWSTDSEPDGVLRKACGNRREAVCPPCAERYRADAYQLIAAGLKGGKGVPDTIAQHPAVFITLTAPSFGVVHARRLASDAQRLPCRPRRDHPVCPHGNRLSCTAIHAEGDACIGEPLCEQCFDYRAAMTWNNTLGTLWRYTTTYVPRAMARLCDMTQVALMQDVHPAYVKVAEYQRRGLVHLHVLARLDRAMPEYRADQLRPPAPRYDVELLEHAIREVVADVSAPVAPELGDGRVRWGQQLDVRQLKPGAEHGEIAGYLAKYATKSTEQAGGLLHRVDADRVDDVKVREHVRRYLRTAFELDAAAAKRRAHTQATDVAPRLGVDDDWNPAALPIRIQRAMSCGEPVRARLRDGSTYTGKVTRLIDEAPERGSTTLAIELNSRLTIHLADVTLIRAARRPEKGGPRLAACAHAFGYRGHCLTKSRRYSTTFKQPQADREAWVHAQILARSRDATQRALADAVERVVMLDCDGIGHVTASDRYYALAEHGRARERRLAGRSERAMAMTTGGRR